LPLGKSDVFDRLIQRLNNFVSDNTRCAHEETPFLVRRSAAFVF
jgi:hypothetical protein